MASKKLFPWRRLVQIIFALLTLLIGIQFYQFVSYYIHPAGVDFRIHPAGVEAFLPISALVALKAWIGTGTFDTIHPAGLVIFLAALAITVIFKRAFCSWICPIGTLSDGLALLGRKIFKKNFTLPKGIDYPLRSLKYILLFLFVVFIFGGMSGREAQAFLRTPYNMIADVKMLQFFLNLSLFGLMILGILVIASILIQNFWCRYLCPYGALHGILSLLSPLKIKRNPEMCIGCAQCTKSCPNQIAVDQLLTVRNVECTGCLNCVEACPVKDTLEFKLPKTRKRLSPLVMGIILILAWISLISFAKITGHWESVISSDLYKLLIPMSYQINF